MKKQTFAVAGYTTWSKKVFREKISKYPGTWKLFSQKDQLTEKALKQLNPEYIFFLHWSWIVPDEIVKKYSCVCFHMTDVPYGRGGSPLQNLIVRGHKNTKLTALKMTEGIDAGPVYLKKPLSLKGKAQDIYQRANELASKMILDIIKEDIIPNPQKGKATAFKRRTPEQGEIKNPKNLEEIYDYIRMLDADGYPRAFIEKDGFVVEFSDAELKNGKLTAQVEINKTKK